jgi:hypothetical protein
MANDERVAKRRLEELLMTRHSHLRDLEAYRKKCDAAGEAQRKQIVKLDELLIREYCAEHGLDLPRDVLREGAE